MKFVDMSNRKVSAIGVGLAAWNDKFEQRNADAIVAKAFDLGINLFDTAELYGSEAQLGRALGSQRERAVIATKVSNWNLQRDSVIAAAQGSLDKLGTDSIDLYQIHWPNFRVPLETTMQGMLALLDQGMIKQVGVCNFSGRYWRRAEQVLGRPVISNQLPFSIVDHGSSLGLVPYAVQNQRCVIAYHPLAQGLLGGDTAPTSCPGTTAPARAPSRGACSTVRRLCKTSSPFSPNGMAPRLRRSRSPGSYTSLRSSLSRAPPA
jgi:aryl-alcohol dehydrogenase-like predicted oxidoreductase